MVQRTLSATAPLIRRMNGLSVLNALREHGPLTTSAVMDHTGLSRASVHALCSELIERGWARELDATPASTSTGLGRPSRTYDFAADAGYVLGVDLGVGTVTVLLADLRGDVVRTGARSTDDHLRPVEDLVHDGHAVIAQVLADSGVEVDRVLDIALGVPGPVDDAGLVAAPNAVVPGLQEADLAAAFGAGRAWRVHIENDANLAVLGEHARGVAVGAGHVAMILAGERLGSGILESGHLVRGDRGEAGELDFLALVAGVGDTKGAGRVARELGAEAVAAYLLEHGAEPAAPADGRPGSRIAALSGSDPERVRAQHVLEAAREGDPAAAEIVETVVDRLARTAAVIATLLAPEIVVLGGAIASVGEELMEPLRRRLGELTKTPHRIEASALGDKAVASGAVHLALEKALPQLLD